MKYLYNPPSAVKMLMKQSQWKSRIKKILFTFDDGPVPGNTEKILKELDKFNIKSVFFCVGSNIQKYPSLAADIIKEGHYIGNHTMNHKILSRASMSEIESEIIPFDLITENILGLKTKYFRPPHGRSGLRLNNFTKKNELRTIMWSLLTYDFKNDINEVKKSLNYLRSDSIIVLHDSIKSKDIIIDSIKLIADTADNKNFETGTPLECLK